MFKIEGCDCRADNFQAQYQYNNPRQHGKQVSFGILHESEIEKPIKRLADSISSNANLETCKDAISQFCDIAKTQGSKAMLLARQVGSPGTTNFDYAVSGAIDKVDAA